MIRFLLPMSLIFILCGSVLSGEFGPEFQVNTYTTDHQQYPEIAFNGTNYLIVWVGGTQDGSYTGVFAQAYDSSGNTLGGEIRVNTHTNNYQGSPSIATNGTKFLVAWASSDQDGDGYGIYGQWFDSDCTKSGSEIQINSYTQDNQMDPEVTSDGTKFLVAWTSQNQDGDGHGIYGQFYDSSEATIGNEFRINSYTDDSQNNVSIASDGTNYFVTWYSDAEANATGVYGKLLDENGNTLKHDFQINVYTTGYQWYPSVSSNGDSYFVAWGTDGQDGDRYAIAGRIIDLNGNVTGSEFVVNTYTTHTQQNVSVSSDGDKYLVTWQSEYQDGSVAGVYGQAIDNDGVFVGSEFQINSTIYNYQQYPVSAFNGDEYLVVWTSMGQDGHDNGIFARFYSTESPPIAVITNNPSGSEGSSVSIIGLGTDPDGGTLTYWWDVDGDGFDDGTGTITSGSTTTLDYTWNKYGTYQVSFKVEDPSGRSHSVSKEVTITNVAPVIDSISNKTVAFDVQLDLSGTFTDPGTGDTMTVIINWGGSEGTTEYTTSGRSISGSHTYSTPGVYNASVTVSDTGGGSDVEYFDVEVTNETPVADAGGPYEVDEGTQIIFDGSGSYDPDGEIGEMMFRWDLDGDSSYDQSGYGLTSPSMTYTDNFATASITITLEVEDEFGLTNTSTAQLTVNNVAPGIDPVSTFNIEEGEQVNLSATYSDPSTSDTHEAYIDWNDGNIDDWFDVSNVGSTDGTVTASNIYYDYGTYVAVLKVKDDDGAESQTTFTVNVGKVPILISIELESNGDPTINFNAIQTKNYEIWYSDDNLSDLEVPGFWKVADTVTEGTFTDQGDPGPDEEFGTADDVRQKPSTLTSPRYYRVVDADTLSTDPRSSADVAVYYNLELVSGRNFAGSIGSGKDLNGILDCRFLPGGVSPSTSVNVVYWEGGSYKEAFIYENGTKKWLDSSDLETEAGDAQVDGGAVLVMIPSGYGTVTIPVAGIAEMSDDVDFTLNLGECTFVRWPYSNEVSIDEAMGSGLLGGPRALLADQVYFWDKSGQKYEQPVFYNTVYGQWYYYDNKTPCTKMIKPGESFLIKTKSTPEWGTSRPYSETTENLNP